MAEIRPITPGDVALEQSKNLPDAVIEVFNQLIAQNFAGGSATVKQEEAVSLMVEKGLNRHQIYKNGYLNIEKVYESAGWTVRYEKPAMDESFDSYFEFKPRRR